MNTLEEWRNYSKDGKLCGILGCGTIPKMFCPICHNHYCFEHIKIHFHIKGEGGISK